MSSVAPTSDEGTPADEDIGTATENRLKTLCSRVKNDPTFQFIILMGETNLVYPNQILQLTDQSEIIMQFIGLPEYAYQCLEIPGLGFWRLQGPDYSQTSVAYNTCSPISLISNGRTTAQFVVLETDYRCTFTMYFDRSGSHLQMQNGGATWSYQ